MGFFRHIVIVAGFKGPPYGFRADELQHLFNVPEILFRILVGGERLFEQPDPAELSHGNHQKIADGDQPRRDPRQLIRRNAAVYHGASRFDPVICKELCHDRTAHGTSVDAGNLCVSVFNQPIRQLRRDLLHAGEIPRHLFIVSGQRRDDQMIPILQQRDHILEIIPHDKGGVDQHNHRFILISKFMDRHPDAFFRLSKIVLLCLNESNPIRRTSQSRRRPLCILLQSL